MFAYALVGYWMLATWAATVCYCTACYCTTTEESRASQTSDSDCERSPIIGSPTGAYR